MVSRSRVVLTVAGVTLLLTVALAVTANAHNMWKEFFVSLFQVVVTAAAAYYFLASGRGEAVAGKGVKQRSEGPQ